MKIRDLSRMAYTRRTRLIEKYQLRARRFSVTFENEIAVVDCKPFLLNYEEIHPGTKNNVALPVDAMIRLDVSYSLNRPGMRHFARAVETDERKRLT